MNPSKYKWANACLVTGTTWILIWMTGCTPANDVSVQSLLGGIAVGIALQLFVTKFVMLSPRGRVIFKALRDIVPYIGHTKSPTLDARIQQNKSLGDDAMRTLKMTIAELTIQHGHPPNQQEIIKATRQISISKQITLNLLRNGTGRYWTIH